MNSLLLLAQSNPQTNTQNSAGMFLFVVVYLAVLVVVCAGLWKVFEKAGEPGWAAIIPIYNLYVMIKIAGRPWWWLLLALIPFISLVLLAIPFDIAKRFGKGVGFGLGLLFLPFIFYLILGFGDAVYIPAGVERRGFQVITPGR